MQGFEPTDRRAKSFGGLTGGDASLAARLYWLSEGAGPMEFVPL